MTPLPLLLFFFVSIAAYGGIPADSAYKINASNTIIDYPEVLQKAGVKKIRCIFKDSHKFIWIGTENGLYRFDGTNVDLLEHETGNRHTIPNNTVVSLVEDNAGNIWAGTLQGAARIDPLTLNCTVFNRELRNYPADFDVKIYAAEDGKIWAGLGTGLSVFDPASQTFRRVWNNRSYPANSAGYITCLAPWKNDTLIAGTFEGIVLINKKDFGYRRLNPPGASPTVISLFVDARQRVWIGTWGGGCLIGDAALNHAVPFKWEHSDKDSPRNIVTGIISTHYDNLPRMWAATSMGIYEIDTSGRNPENFKAIKITPQTNGFIFGLMADDEQHIWQAGNIVSRFYAGRNMFNTLQAKADGVVIDIQPVTVKGQNSIAFASWYAPAGLLITSPAGDRIIYKRPVQRSSAAGDVAGIAKDKYGRFWIATLGGVEVTDSLFRPVSSTQQKINLAKINALKSNTIMICHDTVWVGRYKYGVELYDLNFNRLKTFRPGDKTGFKDDLVERFFIDRNWNVWVCADYYLYRYNKQKGSFTAFNFNKDESRLNAHNLAQLPGGDYLAASGLGLFRFNPNKPGYTAILSPLASREKDVPSVCIDSRGDIWYVNNNQLVNYQVKTGHFTLYGHEDGLSNTGTLGCLRFIDGVFYLAVDRRIVNFSLPDRVIKQQPIKLYIHAVQVNDSLLDRAGRQKLNLRYNENKINIEFGAINFIKPGQNLYAYRLNGVDKKWVFSTINNVTYTNLTPGQYLFNLRAQNYAGLWSTPIHLLVHIVPPWWGTWWFRLGALMLVTGALFVAVRYVLQRNLRERILYLQKEKAVEQERNRIARDMHDDLGSGLTKIAVLSEVTKSQLSDTISATAYLDVISSASRELVDNLQGIIWVLNPKNDSVESLILYLKEHAEGFFEHTPLHVQFVYDPETGSISLSEEKRRNIFLVFKECCNNILKHADCTIVSIKISLLNGKLLVEISDDGVGFDVNAVSRFSNGLQNMRNRMQQVSGDFEIISSPGSGTFVKCRVPV